MLTVEDNIKLDVKLSDELVKEMIQKFDARNYPSSSDRPTTRYPSDYMKIDEGTTFIRGVESGGQISTFLEVSKNRQEVKADHYSTNKFVYEILDREKIKYKTNNKNKDSTHYKFL